MAVRTRPDIRSKIILVAACAVGLFASAPLARVVDLELPSIQGEIRRPELYLSPQGISDAELRNRLREAIEAIESMVLQPIQLKRTKPRGATP